MGRRVPRPRGDEPTYFYGIAGLQRRSNVAEQQPAFGGFDGFHKRLKSFCVAKPMQKLRWTERGWSRGFSCGLWNFRSGLVRCRRLRGASRGLWMASSSPLRRSRGWRATDSPRFALARVEIGCAGPNVFVACPRHAETRPGVCLRRRGWQVMVLGPASGKAGGQTGEHPHRSRRRRAVRPAFPGRRTDR